MKYFFGFIATVGLIILVFVLILRGFSGKKTDPIQAPLTDYATTDTIVRITVDGPIVSDQEHQAYRISVGRAQTHIQALQGYEYSTIDQRFYDNNQESFINFLRAIDLAGFTKGNSKSPNKDERGVCATGSRYVMEIVKGTSSVQRYWSTTCKSGNFKGNSAAIRQLFNRQVPQVDLSALTGRLNL